VVTEILRLLPWWGWLIAYLPIGVAVHMIGEAYDKERLERTGLQPSKDWSRMHNFLFPCWVVFEMWIEGMFE